jgi:hypothetical protein
MGAFIWTVIGWWLFIAFFASFYFWAKKTDRSQAPIERRFTAAGYGLAWPYFAYKAIKSKHELRASLATQQAPNERFPGGAESTLPPQLWTAGNEPAWVKPASPRTGAVSYGISDATAASWTAESGEDGGPPPAYRGTHRQV